MNAPLNPAEARQTMDAAAAKAPGGKTESFAPYLRAAIVYWRLREEEARTAGDVQAELEAVTQRITCEDQFRQVAGRSFSTSRDAITYSEACTLPEA